MSILFSLCIVLKVFSRNIFFKTKISTEKKSKISKIYIVEKSALLNDEWAVADGLKLNLEQK